jgi:hypothetical protein
MAQWQSRHVEVSRTEAGFKEIVAPAAELFFHNLKLNLGIDDEDVPNSSAVATKCLSAH